MSSHPPIFLWNKKYLIFYINSFTLFTTVSLLNPNKFITSLPLPDAPNVSIHNTSSTYLLHPKDEAISIPNFLIPVFNTLFLYTSSCISNNLKQGIDTTSTNIPWFSNSFWAFIPKSTSDPVATIWATGFCDASEIIYAPFLTLSTQLNSALTFIFCLVNTNTDGVSLSSKATCHAAFVSCASAGLITFTFGIALSPANCSIGSWVGPSSPTAIESCVNT